MKKWIMCFGLLVAVAQAKDMTGRFGIGGNTTLGGTNGLLLSVQLSHLLILDATFGWETRVPPGSNAKAQAASNLAAHAFLNLADYENANLLLGAGFNYGLYSMFDHEAALSLEIPLRPVWYVNDHIALFGNVGLNIDILQPGNDILNNKYESTLSYGVSSNILGGFGFLFLF